MQNNVRQYYPETIDLNIKERFGRTAFHRACENGHSEIVEMLIKNASSTNIDLNIKDRIGCTAFHCACVNNH